MDLRQLECFVAVAEENNFTRAAARLHVVQSAVSATIASLERDLHAPLLTRTSRRVHLTEAGRALLPEARTTLDAARAARDAVDGVSGGLRGTLRVGTLSSLGVIDLPGLLSRFRREHPAVAIRVTAASSVEGSPGLMGALRDGHLDIAFVSGPQRPAVGIHVEPVTTTALELVVPSTHPLARRRRIGLADIADESFIDFPAGFGNRSVTDQAFRRAGLTRRVTVEINAIPAGADYVRNDLGVALLPAGAADGYDDLVARPITGADLGWTISLATPAVDPLPATTRSFRALLGERFGVIESDHAPVGRGTVRPNRAARH